MDSQPFFFCMVNYKESNSFDNLYCKSLKLESALTALRNMHMPITTGDKTAMKVITFFWLWDLFTLPAILCPTTRTAVTSARILDEDACYRAHFVHFITLSKRETGIDAYRMHLAACFHRPAQWHHGRSWDETKNSSLIWSLSLSIF